MRTIRLMTGRIYLMVGALIRGGLIVEGGAGDGSFLTTEAGDPIVTEQA